jgi:BTB/POZ domain
VLAAASSYFDGAFVGAGRHMAHALPVSSSKEPGDEAQQLPVVRLPSLQRQQLLAVVRAVYTQRLHVTAENVQDLLACSDFLGVASVTAACCAFLERHLNVSTCVATLRLAAHFNCMVLLKHTVRHPAAAGVHGASDILPLIAAVFPIECERRVTPTT